MLYVGLDYHLNRSTVVILNKDGKKIKTHTVRGGWWEVLKFLRSLGEAFMICYEASTGYGVLFEELSKIATAVKVAHPGQLRLIFRSKRKSDSIDAAKLAKLLYLDEVPVVYVPHSEIRNWRSAIKYRGGLVDERARTKNQIRALLRSLVIKAPRSLWSRAGVAWLQEIELDDPMAAMQRDELLQRLEQQTFMIKRVTKVLDERAKKHPGVQLLMTVPGVGARTAESVVAWVDNPARFASVRQVAAYFGIVTCLDSSAGKDRYGRITREGPGIVRKYLVEAAWQGIRRSPRMRAYYERVQRNDPKRRKVALVATAHYLVRVLAAMLRTGEVWRAEAA